ncbi:hypothetical protein AYO49_01780 [Verrucomicrobiaceae bacterium SCGC AG-212-N21]|nr:hypothetical protein AYO49_01780 [Verrucomicrobiaceae bacterium SCGC AG-212-N21]
MNRRRILLLLRVLCGALLLWWAWRQVDAPLRQVLSTISLDWTWPPVGVLLGGLAVAGWAARWHLFLRLCGISQAPAETVRLTLFADFFNFYFLGPLGADGIRMLMLMRRLPDMKFRILASIILDHASGLLAGALLYAVFTRPQSEWLLSHGHLGPQIALVGADLLLGFIALATISGAVLVCKPAAWDFISRTFMGPTLKPLQPFRFLEGKGPGLLAGLAVSVPILMCTFSTYWAAGMATHQSPTFGEIMAVMPLVDVVCGLPITVSGIGVRESVFVGLLGPHLPQGSQGALLTSLLGFALTGVWGLIGGVWLGLYRLRNKTTSGAAGENETNYKLQSTR